MNTNFSDWNGKIIWSADGLSWSELREILSRDSFPREEVAVKLDRLFLTKYGLDKIAAVQEMGIPVFADAKIVEIPSKTMEIVRLHLEYRPWMLNVMAQVMNTGVNQGMRDEGTTDEPLDVLCDFASACADVGTRSCVVTVLTSKTENLVEYEYNTDPKSAVYDYVSVASSCGVTDIVCSPKEADFLRNEVQGQWTGNLKFNTPGVRLPDSSKDDQARVMSPGEALAKGVDRLVIGRDLSRNGDFAGNLAKILANIREWEGDITG